MAKRGETRPWRVRFEWKNGVKGTSSHITREDAESRAAEIRRNAELRDAIEDLILCEVSHR